MSSKLKKSASNETETLVTEESEQPNKVDRNQMISEAAYYIAEQRGFSPAQENEDWQARHRLAS